MSREQYTPTYEFHSKRGAFTVWLTDDYPMRNRILRYLHEHVQAWIKTGIARSPLEMQGLLQEYLNHAGDGYRMNMLSDDDMGKSVALDLAKTPPPSGKYGQSHRKSLRMLNRLLTNRSRIALLPAWANWTADGTAPFSRTFKAKAYFGGNALSQGQS